MRRRSSTRQQRQMRLREFITVKAAAGGYTRRQWRRARYGIGETLRAQVVAVRIPLPTATPVQACAQGKPEAFVVLRRFETGLPLRASDYKMLFEMKPGCGGAPSASHNAIFTRHTKP